MNTLRSLAVAATVAALGLGLTACGSGSDKASSDRTTATSGKNLACPTGTLTFGVEPYDDASKLIPAYQNLAKDLGDKLGCKVDLKIAESYVAEILAMKNGQLDLGEFGPAGFVFADQQAGAVPLASFADADGKVSTYTAGIWVKKGSPITDLKGLAGHTLALSSTGSTSGDWVPRYALIQAGVQDQVKSTYAGGHPQSLEALTHGTVDAAEINSQMQATAEKDGSFDASQYTQIWKSDPILNDPVTASPKLSSQQQATIKAALLSLTGADFTAGGDSAIATELDFTPPTSGPAMVAVTKDDYQPLFDLAAALKLTSKDL
jgi:phosphonate transport system substrate-binding protein